MRCYETFSVQHCLFLAFLWFFFSSPFPVIIMRLNLQVTITKVDHRFLDLLKSNLYKPMQKPCFRILILLQVGQFEEYWAFGKLMRMEPPWKDSFSFHRRPYREREQGYHSHAHSEYSILLLVLTNQWYFLWYINSYMDSPSHKVWEISIFINYKVCSVMN